MNQFQNVIFTRFGLVGYDKVEPTIIMASALGIPIRLSGSHGTAKTQLAVFLAQAERGKDYMRLIDCPTENIITLFGMPNVKKMGEEGVLEFVDTAREGAPGHFLWSKTGLIFNEHTRMSADSQNAQLTVLNERMAFGKKLPIAKREDPTEVNYVIIGTENPTGTGIKIMDPAYLDRWPLLVDVPHGQQSIGQAARRAIVGANIYHFERDPSGRDEVVGALFGRIRQEYKEVLSDPAIVGPVVDFGVSMWEAFFQAVRDVYVSPRRIAWFTEIILGYVAYSRAVEEVNAAGRVDLKLAASRAIDHAIVLPLKLEDTPKRMLMDAFNAAGQVLTERTLLPKERFKAALALRPVYADKISFLAQSNAEFKELIDFADRDRILGDCLKNAQPTDLIPLYQLLLQTGGHEEVLRRTELRIVGQLSQRALAIRKAVDKKKIYNASDLVTFDRLREFAEHVAQGHVQGPVIDMLLKPQGSSVDLEISNLVSTCESVAQSARR